MTEKVTSGKRFRIAVSKEKPLQIVGTINAYCARIAERAGYKAIYLSGAGVANASFGLPDLAMTSQNDVIEDARRITDCTDVPLLVDIDTGWGSELNIEDQVSAKRCGHRPGKQLVSAAEMTARIKAATQARNDESFVIMVRTDAIQSEGLNGAIDRAAQYVEAGADMLFIEAVTELEQYKKLTHEIHVPILANITEFGVTPLFTLEELRNVGISMALYPVSAFRAMNQMAIEVYQTIRQEGTQKSLLNKMQTRESLYEYLDYYTYEKKLSGMFK